MNLKMRILKDMNTCYGCGACLNACPVKAIEMHANPEGFIEPCIDEEKCIECNKCKNVCIAHQPKYFAKTEIPTEFYAITAESFWLESSSGGVFSLLGEYAISNNGVVFGAAFSSDWEVEHIEAHNSAELVPLKLSKYVQSDTKRTFSSVKEYLKSGRLVIYVGCACQIAGLISFLEGVDQEKLITVDLLCHGVPSPGMFREHLENKFGLDNIKNVEMRNRDGWSSCLHVELNNGEIYHYNNRKEIFGLAFHKDLILRKTCYECRFSKIPRQGDLTIGDMWEAANLKLGYPYEKKSSLALVNSEKGGKYLTKVLNDPTYKVEYIKLNDINIGIEKLNRNISKPSATKFEKREVFWKNYEKMSFEEAAWKAFYPNSVGMLLYMSNNYGSVATNYALYEAIKVLGYTPIVCDNLVELRGISKRFAEKHMQLASKFMKTKDYENANLLFDSFIVGSDQTYRFDSPFVIKNIECFLMTFAKENKRRIVYAGSFGPETYTVDDKERKLFKHAFSSMSDVSFREDYAVKMSEKLFERYADWVCDPVFLPEREVYIKLAKESKLKDMERPFLLAYIRFASDERIELIRTQAKLNKLKAIVICDATSHKKLAEKMSMDEIIEPVEFVDWLWYYIHADMVITDSFHGTCFSIIMQKKFLAIKAGTKQRFDSLAHMFETTLDKVQIYENIKDMISNENAIKCPDYSYISEIIQKVRKKGFQWLEKALSRDVNPDNVFATDILLNESLLYADNFTLSQTRTL